MSSSPNLFFSSTIKEIEASEEALSNIFALVKTGTAITLEKLKNKCDKDVLAKEVIRLVSRLQKNVETMKKACSEVEMSRNETHDAEKKVIGLQEELLDCNRDQIGKMQTAITEKLATEMKTYSEVFKRNLDQPPNITLKSIKTAVKDAIDQKAYEPDRTRNVIVFGLGESIDGSLEQSVGKIFEELNSKPKLEAVVRVGRENVGKSRPVKVTLKSASAASDILKCSKDLKTSREYSSVYICPDRSPEQQEKHKKLVGELRNKIAEDPAKRWYIRRGQLMCDEQPSITRAPESTTEVSVSRGMQEEEKIPMKVTQAKRGARGGRVFRRVGRVPVANFSDYTNTDATTDTD